jgi:hypothetical protein
VVALDLRWTPGLDELREVVEDPEAFPFNLVLEDMSEIGEISDISVVFCTVPTIGFIFSAAFPKTFVWFTPLHWIGVFLLQFHILLTLVYIHFLSIK